MCLVSLVTVLLCLDTEAFTEPDDPVFPLAVLQSVGVALTYVPVLQLNNNSLPPRFIADQKTNLPEPLQTLLNTFCPLLLFKARPLQITVYHLLEKYVRLCLNLTAIMGLKLTVIIKK